MASSSSTGPSGTYPPSYSATVPPIVQRTSYASVVSGTAAFSTPPYHQHGRSGLVSQIINFTPYNGAASSQSLPHSPHSHPFIRPSNSSFPFSGALQQVAEHMEARSMSQYPQLFSLGGETGGTPILDSRPSDFFVPSYLRGSTHVERLEEKYRSKVSAQKDGRSGRSSTNGSLSTSASSMSLPKIIPSHRGMTYDIQEKHFAHVEDSASPLPSRWSLVDKYSGLEVIGDGLEIRYNGGNKTTDEVAAVRSDHPIPKQCGIYYFEITILSKSKECLVAIGLSGPNVVLNKPPGWEVESWAYHGDDGYSFCETSSGKTFGPKYTFSDVIGCGINFSTGSVFYTKNGVYLGVAFKEVKVDVLHPIIGMKKPSEHIRVNLGQSPFVYDIDSLVTREKQVLLDQVAKEDVVNLDSRRDEASLLQELIVQYLAHEGYRDTAKSFGGEVQKSLALLRGEKSSSQTSNYEEDVDAMNRQYIRTAILEGDIDKALKQTKAFYPTVLQENENIYFKLRCRKFVEMIRKCTLLQPKSLHPSAHGSSSGNNLNGLRKSLQEDYNDVFDGGMELDYTEFFDPVIGEHRNVVDGQTCFDNVAKQNELMIEALQYGQELRAEFKDDFRRETRKELEDTFALIAYPDARESSLASLLEVSGRIPVAEELSRAILVSLGKSSTAALERLVQQTEVLVSDLGITGGGAALLNIRNDYMR